MGTSMAAPHAAGVAALIVGAGVTKPEMVEEILLGTARRPRATSGLSPAVGASEARIDDHYGAGLLDAHAALRKIRAGRGGGELGLAAALALLGTSLLGRRGRGRGIERLGLAFVPALIAGSSGLFLLRFLFGGSTGAGAVDVLASGALDGIDTLLPPAFRGSPLVWSAILPVGLTALSYGVPRLRGALAGFGFGVAGALLCAAIAGTFDVRGIPNLLDAPWLLVNAGVSAVLATAVLRR
jgi:serine protease